MKNSLRGGQAGPQRPNESFGSRRSAGICRNLCRLGAEILSKGWNAWSSRCFLKSPNQLAAFPCHMNDIGDGTTGRIAMVANLFSLIPAMLRCSWRGKPIWNWASGRRHPRGIRREGIFLRKSSGILPFVRSHGAATRSLSPEENRFSIRPRRIAFLFGGYWLYARPAEHPRALPEGAAPPTLNHPSQSLTATGTIQWAAGSLFSLPEGLLSGGGFLSRKGRLYRKGDKIAALSAGRMWNRSCGAFRQNLRRNRRNMPGLPNRGGGQSYDLEKAQQALQGRLPGSGEQRGSLGGERSERLASGMPCSAN